MFFFPISLCLFLVDKPSPIAYGIFAFGVLITIPIQFFSCPKCGDCFFYKLKFFGWYDPFAKNCVHCGFLKWEEPPEKIAAYPIPRRSALRPDPAIAEAICLKNFLTLVLRDDPRAIGLKLDSEGWADVNELSARAAKNGVSLNLKILVEVIGIKDPPCFEWDHVTNRIRFCR